MNIIERIIVYRDRPGRSREGRDLLADAANEIDRLALALKKYGCHAYDCDLPNTNGKQPCSCGWSDFDAQIQTDFTDVVEKPA